MRTSAYVFVGVSVCLSVLPGFPQTQRTRAAQGHGISASPVRLDPDSTETAIPPRRVQRLIHSAIVPQCAEKRLPS